MTPGCPDAPGGPIAGLPRRERLRRTLQRRGYQVREAAAGDATSALVIPDCRLPLGDEVLHLCEEGTRTVEDRLLRALRKPIDGWVSRTLNRPISLFFTRRLMNTSIRPNQVSLVNLVLGLLCGVVVFQGGYVAAVLGALLLHTQSVLDGVDGELARLRFQGSKLGQWLDTLSDDLSNLSFMVGATLVAPMPYVRTIGTVGIVAFVVTQATLYYALVRIYRSGDLLAFRWDAHGTPGPVMGFLGHIAKRDFFCLAFVGLAIADLLHVGIIVWGIGAVGVLITLIRQVLRHGLGPGPARG